MFDTVIVGGGTAGMTAAIYLLRAGKKVLVLESTALGGQITASPQIENFPGLPGISGAEYADRLAEQVYHFGGKIEPVEVNGVQQTGKTFIVTTTDDDRYEAKSVILACGAAHRHLGLAREETLAGISYCAICDGAFYKGKDVAVVGGGNSAVQSALLLAELCRHVTLIHRRAEFRCEPVLLDRLQKAQNVSIRTGGVINALLGEEKLSGLEVQFGEKKETLSADGLFVAIGQTPANGPFQTLVKLDQEGYILAGEDCKTSAEGVFAAGDCRQKQVRQLATAAGDGAVAGLAANAYLEASGS
ncbi:MAG: thioredoxin-disulfide reductase [Clostridiales bacterium]|nr:MAG: thioredoxin-disulfide reductase [Clostridiales bacterium]